MAISFVVKGFLLGLLIPQGLRAPTIARSWLLLIVVLLCSMVGDFSWIIKLLRQLIFPEMPYIIVTFCIRIAWAFLILQYLALGLFLESLIDRVGKFKWFQLSTIIMSSSFFAYFMYLAFCDKNLIDESARNLALKTPTVASWFFEISIMRLTIMYVLPILVLPSLFKTIHTLRTNNLPKILKHQLRILIKYLMVPYLLSELVIAINFAFISMHFYTNAIVAISAALITYIVYYCIHKVMGLRFLNFTNHVESSRTFNFIDDFKIVLEHLSNASTIWELGQITSAFFKSSCGISPRKTAFFVRTTLPSKENSAVKLSAVETSVEEYLSNHADHICSYIKEHKILIYDEICFSNFYHENATRTSILRFLENSNADIFLPIFAKDRIIAYIIVEMNARPAKLYCSIERDEMLVFSTYLGNIINLMQNRNLEVLMHQEHELKEEIYKKHQEINHYKESIRSFLKNGKHRDIGILFYKNRRFIYANQIAREMIKININMQEGHPISRALKNLARQVEQYKSPQTTFAKDTDGTRLVISGVPNLEQNNVIITVSYPDITDVISKQMNLLKDPTKWDYLLYLETTKPGQLINQLIPGSGEALLQFKIELLQTALSKKATLLEMVEEDIAPTVELLHHISMRETIHTIALQTQSQTTDIAVRIFGINPIYGIAQTGKPLLESLDGIGTLFIQNIEFLDRETQDYLAEFIRYGYYKVYKSDQRISADVRIIASSHKQLQTLVQEGTFSPLLFAELNKAHVSMPSLITLPEVELNDLLEGFGEQALKQNDFKSLLELSEKDRLRLLHHRPASLQELKTKVQQIMITKSKSNNINEEVHFDPAYEITDPELILAVRMGKQALKDQKIMETLWNKFKNQNKIATFLGVNRSSVNRRCKEYKLIQ